MTMAQQLSFTIPYLGAAIEKTYRLFQHYLIRPSP